MRIGIADTMFARVNMGQVAIETINGQNLNVEIERYTVPGFKDLPVACKRLFTKYSCNIVLALGWVGKEDIDEVCSHEANTGLIAVEVEQNKHILKIFFHEKETANEQEQKEICQNRVRKHTLNAISLVNGKEELTPFAGDGKRQGYGDAGEIK
jgi:riboflavin synthase